MYWLVDTFGTWIDEADGVAQCNGPPRLATVDLNKLINSETFMTRQIPQPPGATPVQIKVRYCFWEGAGVIMS